MPRRSLSQPLNWNGWQVLSVFVHKTNSPRKREGLVIRHSSLRLDCFGYPMREQVPTLYNLARHSGLDPESN